MVDQHGHMRVHVDAVQLRVMRLGVLPAPLVDVLVEFAAMVRVRRGVEHDPFAACLVHDHGGELELENLHAQPLCA